MILGFEHNKRKIREILDLGASLLRPRPKLTPSQWAEKNVFIPEGNAIEGMIRFDNAPYQREPLDCFADDTIQKITLMFGAQTGKTNILNCAIGYNIEYDPQTQMMMQPTQTDIGIWLETKLKPMISVSPYLNQLVAKPRSREGVNNNKMVSYPGGFLLYAWAGSPNTVHGRSPSKTYADECDRYEIIPGQGNPANLMEQRTATHGEQAKNAISSTPSIKGASYVESSFLSGDQRRFYVPCHACGHEQYYKWSCLTIPKNEQGEDMPDKAAYHCESCGVIWTHRDKIVANKKGRWIAEKPFNGHASFHLPELASNFRTWVQIAKSYLDKVATGDLQVFVNVSLAETWEEKGDQVEPNILAERAIEFSAYIPKQVLILTAGIDCQPDRIELELVGWTGENRQSYSIEHKIFYGDITLDEKHPDSPWKELLEFLKQDFIHETGVTMKISASFIDSGDGNTTMEVYNFCYGKKRHGIYAMKGKGKWNMPFVTESRAEKAEKRTTKKKQSLPLMIVGVSEIKLRILRDLFVDDPKDAGYCYFPTGRDPEYFEQLTSEQLIYNRTDKGYAERVWKKIRPRNEALDCRVYALAALAFLKPNYNSIRQTMISKTLELKEQEGEAVKRIAEKIKKVIEGKTPLEEESNQEKDKEISPIKKSEKSEKRKKKIIIRNGRKEVLYI